LTDDRAFGADDVAGTLYAGERLRKLRFLMNDHGPRRVPSRRMKRTPGRGTLSVLPVGKKADIAVDLQSR
jgi:hypothetical protein